MSAHDNGHTYYGEPRNPAWNASSAEPAAETPPATTPAWHSRIVAVGEDWYTSAPPPRDWLLRDARTSEQRGWLPHHMAGLLIAEGGAGKTMSLVQLAIPVAKGGAWFGVFPVETKGRVFMLLGEEDADEARRRIHRAHAGVGSPPAAGAIEILPMAGVECAFLARDQRGGAIETPFVGELRDYLKRTGPWALIIAEPLSRVSGPDAETDNAAGTRLVQVFESLAAATGATVLGAHHTSKAGRGGGVVNAKDSRGSTALTDGFRWVASLATRKTESQGKVVTLSVVKTNCSFEGDPLLLRWADNGRLEPLSGQQQAQAEAEFSGETARKDQTAQKEAEREAARVKKEASEAARKAERDREKAVAAVTKR
jgi:RecA-family ATPase